MKEHALSSAKPIRFGTVFHGFSWELEGSTLPPEEVFIEAARNAEKIGYSTFAFNDHLTTGYAPIIAGQAVADATTTLRLS